MSLTQNMINCIQYLELQANTLTDSWISSTTIEPELSTSNILKAQLTSSWNLIRENRTIKKVLKLIQLFTLLLPPDLGLISVLEIQWCQSCLCRESWIRYWGPCWLSDWQAPEHHVGEVLPGVDGGEKRPELFTGHSSLEIFDEPNRNYIMILLLL